MENEMKAVKYLHMRLLQEGWTQDDLVNLSQEIYTSALLTKLINECPKDAKKWSDEMAKRAMRMAEAVTKTFTLLNRKECGNA